MTGDGMGAPHVYRFDEHQPIYDALDDFTLTDPADLLDVVLPVIPATPTEEC